MAPGCFQDLDVADQLGGTGTDLVYLDVVAMAIAAAGVIAEQQPGVLIPEDPGELGGRLLWVRAREPRSGRRVRKQHRPVSAVGIPQVHDPGGAQRVPAGLQFPQPPVRRLPDDSVGGRDDDHAVSLCGQLGQRATVSSTSSSGCA